MRRVGLWASSARRSRATSANPLYQDGIRVVATTFKTKQDDGSLLAGDAGATYGYTQYPIEWAAQVFAFMSLVENDPTVRADYASRSRTLLMYMMNKAVLGPIPGDGDFRGRVFSTDMRSLFYGDAFPTTVTGKVQKFVLRAETAADLGLAEEKTA